MKKILLLLLTFYSFTMSAMTEQTAVFDFSVPWEVNINPPVTESGLGTGEGILQTITNRTITDGPVTISFESQRVGAGICHYDDKWGLLLGMGTKINFTVTGGCYLVSIAFDQPSVLTQPIDQPGRWNSQNYKWECQNSTPTSLTLLNGNSSSVFYKIIVKYSSPATPLNFSYSSPSDGSSVAAFNKMSLYYNTSISKVNTDKQVLLTGGNIEGAKVMTASASGSSVTLSLNETISEEGNYNVSVPNGIFVTSEGALNTALSISFTIVPKRDTFTPTSVDPASGSTVGHLPKVIKLTFPSFVKTGTGTVKFKTGGTSQFAGSVSVNNNVATITHDHDFTEASTWIVEIPEKMFHNDFPADDVDYRWSPKLDLTYKIDGSEYVPAEPTIVTPTATLSSEAIEKGGDELVLKIGHVVKATLTTTAKPVFKYADGEKSGETVPFEVAILTAKSDTEFNVNTTGLSVGKYSLVLPKETFVYELGANEVINDVELTVPFEVLTNDSDTPTMKAARALLEQTGVGYPSIDSESYKALKALVNATEVPTDEVLQAAIDALYNETAVTMPAVDSWYKIAGVNAAGKKVYLTFSEDKTKVLLGTSAGNAAAFKVKSVEDGKVVFQTKEGFFLHVLTTLPMHEGTSDANLTETESDINKLTLAKFLASSVEGVAPKDLYGMFTIYGSLGTVNGTEEFAYALLNYDNTAISTYPSTPLQFNASMSNAFVLTETIEPTEVIDYAYLSIGMRPDVIENPGDDMLLVIFGPKETTIKDASKIYYLQDEKKVEYSEPILTLTETANIFSVNTKNLPAGYYTIMMEVGAFDFVAPEGKTIKENELSATFTIHGGGSPVTPTTVIPTASLLPDEPVVAGDALVLTIGNVKKATLSTEAKPIFKYADGEKAGEVVSFTGTILTKKSDTQFNVATTGLPVGKYTLVMPKGTFAYEVEEGKAVEDKELTVAFEIKDNSSVVTDDFQYVYGAYIIFFPASRYRVDGYYKDVDLNELVLYVHYSMYNAMVADPSQIVEVKTPFGGTVMKGHFENYPDFAKDYGAEFEEMYAIKFVPEVPLKEGDLDNWGGDYYYSCKPATWGDSKFGEWLQGTEGVTRSMCIANPKLSVGSFLVYNDRVTGISTIDGEHSVNKTIYDLQGRPVTTPAKKGVYIVNGKKVVMK